MISVIMLTYNREDLVGRAIESILNQTYRDFEFIIVDNGSTDRSGQIADTYAEKDSRIRVIHKERGNIGAGRNAGLDAAQGEYITFIDDDDYTEPEYLAYLHSLIVEHSADVAMCGSWREVDGARQPKYMFDGVFTYSGEEAVCELLKRERFNSANPTKLVSADIFRRVRYSESGKYDDIRVIYKLFACADRVCVSGVPLYTFVRHIDNNSAGTTAGESIPAGQVEEYLDAFRERTVWLTERFPDRADFWLYTELSYALSMYDKTDIPALRKKLGGILRENAAVFRDMERFHTQRDAELLKKYGGDRILFQLNKFSLIITTRCNLKCRLCCEYTPQNKPFPDMTLDEEQRILDAFFQVADHVDILHLTGGGEPFLHPKLPEMIELAMNYADRFDRLMLFTNCTVPISPKLLETIKAYQEKVFLQVSLYHQPTGPEEKNLRLLEDGGINCRIRKYYGEDQSFGGWVDFGPWEETRESAQELERKFQECSVTKVMHGNWRTRDGKVHWCSRSQRGMDLGLIPDNPDDYVDLFDSSESVEEKQEKFRRIADAGFISACRCCSGDQGTEDQSKRHPAAEQIG